MQVNCAPSARQARRTRAARRVVFAAPRPAGRLMAARLSVDEARCTGHGRCYDTAPTLLSDDDDGFVTLRGQSMEVPEDELAAARRAVTSCPERAVKLEQD